MEALIELIEATANNCCGETKMDPGTPLLLDNQFGRS
jgi:hypothetical protein